MIRVKMLALDIYFFYIFFERHKKNYKKQIKRQISSDNITKYIKFYKYYIRPTMTRIYIIKISLSVKLKR